MVTEKKEDKARFKAVILGASGYAGSELVRLLSCHDFIEVVALCGDRKAGLDYARVYPHLSHLNAPQLKAFDQIDFSDIDLVFSAMPHSTSASNIKKIPKDIKVIDLSADFRIKNLKDYEYWYGLKHPYPEGVKESVYGLTEFYRDRISSARIVACTGCNAATALYPLLPLLKHKLIDVSNIIVDIKTGISGAGRSLREDLLHSEISEGVAPYGLSGHRHLAEIRQELSYIAGECIDLTFIPHLLPQNRGILGSIYVNGDAKLIHKILTKHYESEYFIYVLPFGEAPSTKHIRGSNFCHIGVIKGTKGNQTILFCAIDNLVKGSAGQALQNANLVLNIDEQHALKAGPIFP